MVPAILLLWRVVLGLTLAAAATAALAQTGYSDPAGSGAISRSEA
jgi:hypothetical protein